MVRRGNVGSLILDNYFYACTDAIIKIQSLCAYIYNFEKKIIYENVPYLNKSFHYDQNFDF